MAADRLDSSLNGTPWKLERIGPADAPITPRREATLVFRDGTLGGSTGCNRYNAAWTRENGRFGVGAIATTRMHCDGVMEQERALLASLQSARALNIADGRLMIASDHGVLAFVAGDPPIAVLNGSAWRLTGFEVAGARVSIPDAIEITIAFQGDRVSGSAGCNRFAGSYVINGARIIFGALAATLRACSPPRMELEQRFLAALHAAGSVAVHESQMALSYTSGRLIFAAQTA